jgi:hypothetical protein
MERVDQPLADYAAPLGVSCPCALTILIGFRMRSACAARSERVREQLFGISAGRPERVRECRRGIWH